jgi:hypothetical protein
VAKKGEKLGVSCVCGFGDYATSHLLDQWNVYREKFPSFSMLHNDSKFDPRVHGPDQVKIMYFISVLLSFSPSSELKLRF